MSRNAYVLIFALSVSAVLAFTSCTRGESDNKEEQASKDTQTETINTDDEVKTDHKGMNGEKEAATLDTVLSGYYKAIGGPERWNAVKTIKYTGNMNSMGKQFKTAFVYERPDKCRLDFSVENIYFIQAYDGEQGWKYNPTAPHSKPDFLEGEDLNDIKETCDFDGPLIDYDKKGHKIEYAGTENVEGKDGYKIKITYNTGNVDYYYLDAQTYLPFLVKGTTKVNGKETPSTTYIGDYIDTGGLMLPYDFKYDVEGAEASEILRISTVEINPEIDDTIFRFPRRIEDSY